MYISIIFKTAIFICLIIMPEGRNADLLSWAEQFFPTDNLPSTVEQALGKVTSEIVDKYFMNARCLVIISRANYSNPIEIFEFMPRKIPFVHIHFSHKDIDNILRPEVWYQNKGWFTEAFKASFDHRCEGFIFQVPNLAHMIQAVNKATKFCSQRLTRRYVFLPVVSGANIPSPEAWNEEIHEMFLLYTMRIFPDLIILKEVKKTNDNDNVRNEINFKNINVKEQGDSECNKQYAAHNASFEDFIHFGNASSCKNISSHKSAYSDNLRNPDKETNEYYKHESNVDTHLGARQRMLSNRVTKEFSFKIITHRYVNPNPTEAVELDIWDSHSGFHKNSPLYPDKLLDMMGKPFYITTFTYLPFSFLEFRDGKAILDGYEYRIIREFIKKLNMTVSVIFSDNTEGWGSMYKNGTGEGLVKLVAEETVDMSFTALNYWDSENSFMDYSIPSGWSKLTTLTPKPLPLPRIFVPIYPFSHGMWIAVVIYLGVTMFLLYGLSNITLKLFGPITNPYSSLSECAFRTLGLFVLQAPDDERDQSVPHHIPMRHLVNWLVVQYLIITTAYAAGLASILTSPRFARPIETAEDLALSGVTWSGFDIAYTNSIRPSTDPLFITLCKNFYLGTVEALDKRFIKGDIAFAIERLQGGSFALQPFMNEEYMDNFRLMGGQVFDGHLGFLLRKGGPFLEKLDKLIYNVRETGIPMFLEREVARQYMNQRLQIAIVQTRDRSGPDLIKLQLDHVEGAFILLAAGILVSTIGFMGEHIYFRLHKAKRKSVNGSKNENWRRMKISVLSDLM